MPELPEVETLRRDLEKEVVGRRIKAVQVNGTRSVRRVRHAWQRWRREPLSLEAWWIVLKAMALAGHCFRRRRPNVSSAPVQARRRVCEPAG